MARARVENPWPTPFGSPRCAAPACSARQHEDAFDRLAGLARTFSSAPMAMVTLLDDRTCHVRPRRAARARQGSARAGHRSVLPARRHHGGALVVDDAREHELTQGLAAVKSGKVLAYAGVPLALPGGRDRDAVASPTSSRAPGSAGRPRSSRTSRQSVLTEIEMRADIEARKQAETDSSAPTTACAA